MTATERCRECRGGIFVRRTGTPSRRHAVSRYPPDGSLREGEAIVCRRCGTPYRVLYDGSSLSWRIRQQGPPERLTTLD
ncbi:MAG: hypothetical protein ACYDDF_01370 [Thermoplasmatota archaeon]